MYINSFYVNLLKKKTKRRYLLQFLKNDHANTLINGLEIYASFGWIFQIMNFYFSAINSVKYGSFYCIKPFHKGCIFSFGCELHTLYL